MTHFNTIKALGYGMFLWLIVTALVGAVYGFGLYFNLTDSQLISLTAAIVAGGIAVIFAKEINVASLRQAQVYSLLWLAILVALDFIIIAPLAYDIFNSWQYWFGHLLVMVAPWLVYWFNTRSTKPQ